MRKAYCVELIHMDIRFHDNLTRQESIARAWRLRDGPRDVGGFDTYEDAYLCLVKTPVRSIKLVNGYSVYMTAICHIEYDETGENITTDQYLLIRAQDPETEDEVIKFYDLSGRELDEYEIDESFYSDKD